MPKILSQQALSAAAHACRIPKLFTYIFADIKQPHLLWPCFYCDPICHKEIDINNSPFIYCKNTAGSLIWQPCLFSCNTSLFWQDIKWSFLLFIGMLVGSQDTAGDMWFLWDEEKPSGFFRWLRHTCWLCKYKGCHLLTKSSIQISLNVAHIACPLKHLLQLT